MPRRKRLDKRKDVDFIALAGVDVRRFQGCVVTCDVMYPSDIYLGN
jgi:hypothetical protein